MLYCTSLPDPKIRSAKMIRRPSKHRLNVNRRILDLTLLTRAELLGMKVAGDLMIYALGGGERLGQGCGGTAQARPAWPLRWRSCAGP